jgi:hypothetical protein
MLTIEPLAYRTTAMAAQGPLLRRELEFGELPRMELGTSIAVELEESGEPRSYKSSIGRL